MSLQSQLRSHPMSAKRPDPESPRAFAQPEVVKAVIDLDPRPDDESLDEASVAQLELFQGLKKMAPIKKNPGAMILRRFRAGATICRQGERGTAPSMFSLPPTC